MKLKRPRDRFVNIGGINTRFWVAGEQGPAIILVHGIGAAVESWENNIGALSAGHRVYAVDLAGFGRSGKPNADYTLSFFSRFLKNFIDAQHLEKVSLVGWSLGGGVSLQFAIQFPYKLERLVLVAPVGLGKKISLMFRMIAVPGIGKMLSRPNRRGTEQLLKQCVFDPAVITREVVALYYRYAALPGGHAAWHSTLKNGIGLGGVRSPLVRHCLDNLQMITVPTLIIWGKQDRIFPVSQAYAAEKKFPNAGVHVIDECGHMPQFEHPEVFNDVMLKFLSKRKD